MKKFLAMLMAGTMLLSFAACDGKEEEETTVAPEETTVEDVAGNADETEAEAETEIVTEVVTNEDGETEVVTEVVAKEEKTTKKGDKNEKTTAKKEDKKTTEAEKVDDPSKWSTEKILDYSNTVLNKVKSGKAGYNKNAVMEIKGNVAGVPEVLRKIFQTNKSTSMAKGSDNTNDFPAAGFSWSTKLRAEDVESATLKVNGSTYDIMIKLGTEKNPGKGTKSSYGRAVSVIDAAEAANIIPFGINSVDMLYHDGYIHIKVDSKTEKVTYAQFSAAADAKANLAVLGNVQADSITSTETFTNFVW